MAEINWGILDTQLPGRIAAIPQQQQAQQAQNAMQLMQLQQSMQQNALAKAKMEEYTRGVAEKNALRGRMTQPGFDIYNPQHQTEIMGLSPELAPGLIQHALKVRETEAVTAKNAAQTAAAQTKAAVERQNFVNQARRDLARNPSDDNIKAWTQDAVIQKLFSSEQAAQIEANMLRVPLSERKTIFESSGAPAVAPEKAPAPPAMVAEYTFAKTPAGGNFVGTFQDFVTARAKAGRAPAQPSAPTITQIVDPTDATKMITIDARRYTGGGAGSPGVIGVAGKEPSAAIRVNKQEEGKSLLADEISNLRAALDKLNAARAIPSTERGALSNISSSLASSGVGQIAGRIVGTEAQTERDVISSSKLRLVNAIKQATGMSAQQLNSNVELQTMLKSLSDPSQSIEANIRNLDNIEKAYVNTTSAAMPRAPAAATTPKAAQSDVRSRADAIIKGTP
jgi:hypothetical protein